ncbi:non-canonical purine NTP pyrophosphatase, RdgB/HAM1 family [Candidatus Parcubacteria bacterium]|nr:MAG: non-canonical purine NTP pyrophosphatase, RdgB/HAM1 family [Candidatus Parcubacteria bacterium]
MKNKQLLIGTANQGKLEEIKLFLDDLPFEILGLNDLDQNYPEPEEDGATLEENAMKKAQYYGEKSGIITLADDTGLFVNALDMWPGIHAARVAKTDEARCQLLLEKMEGKENRQASFRGVIALYDPKTKNQFLTQGKVDGTILDHIPKKNKYGHGYDPMFFSEQLNKTFDETPLHEKNAISHRGQALNKIKYFLQNNYGAKHIVVSLPMIIQNGKLLITKRNDPHREETHGKWEFPGGIVDLGETGESTAVKEAKEEADYDVEVVQQISKIKIKDHTFPDFSYQVYLVPYVCRLLGGKGNFNKTEVLEMEWIELDQHRNFEFLAGDNDFLDEIMEELENIIKKHNL